MGWGNNDLFISYLDTIRHSLDGKTWNILKTTEIKGYFYFVNSDHAGHLFICSNNLYRSTDNGESWSKIVNGLSNTLLYSLTVAPNNDIYGYKSHDWDFVYKSTDGGRTWKVIHFTQSPDLCGVNSLSINKDGKILLFDPFLNWFYTSSDAGSSWDTLPKPSIPISPNARTICYSNDQSTTFIFSTATGCYLLDPLNITKINKLAVPNGNTISVIAHPNGNIIGFTKSYYSGSNPYSYGWFSNSNGNSWSLTETISPIDNGSIQEPPVYALALDSSKSILGSTSGSIIKSTDEGASWKIISPDLTNGIHLSIAVSYNGTIFAPSTTEGVFRSTDNGITWDQLNSGITDQHLYSVAVHQNGDVYAGGKNVVYRSTDAGISWTTLNTNFPAAAQNISAMVVSTQGNIIAGIDNVGVYWSQDNGTTWTERATGLTAKKVNSLLSTPSGKVFAATDSGVFFLDITTGATWQQVNNGLTSTNVLSICRNSAGKLFAGTDASGVFSSLQTFNIASQNAVKRTNDKSADISLGANYPNPFSSQTTIPFSIKERGNITLEIYDALGRSVTLLASGVYEGGTYEAKFDASKLGAGSYVVRLQAGEVSLTKPLTIIR